MMKLLFTKQTVFRVGFLLVFFLIGSVMFAQNPNQKISIKAQNISIKEFLKQIEIMTTFTVVYRDILVDDKKDITVNANNKPLTDVLKIVLAPKDLQAVFNINTIVITKKNVEPQITNKTKIVTGVVLDEKGQPVIGASVIIPGTTIGVATDINGRFRLEAPSSAKLRISYIGYDAKEELLSAGSDLKIKLDPTPQILKELVITAQAIGQKNAILQQINSNTIKNVVAADRLQENPDANATEAIGRLPGIAVQRQAGEGVGLVIRGLEPRYSNVTMNGIDLPSTGSNDKSTSINGISQYSLQGAEVYKSLTANMDANAVAGTVNLKLREAPKGFHANFMAQGGYNNLNNYLGNYKFLVEASNRFFNNKLGVLFTSNIEKVNRSDQNMAASYGFVYDKNDKNKRIFLSNGIGLNIVKRFIYRKSAMLAFDYKIAEHTTLMLNTLYSNSKSSEEFQSKGYGLTGTGSLVNAISFVPENNTRIIQSSLTGETKFKFLSLKLDYGISFSEASNKSDNIRNWTFVYKNPVFQVFTEGLRKNDPKDLINLFVDSPDSLNRSTLQSMSKISDKMTDRNVLAYLNFNLPFNISNDVDGTLKFGAKFKKKYRIRDYQYGTVQLDPTFNSVAGQLLSKDIDWLSLNNTNAITAQNLTGNLVPTIIDGYRFGYTYNLDKLNQIYNTWITTTDYYSKLPDSEALPIIFDRRNASFSQDAMNSTMNDQNLTDVLNAGYFLAEMNITKYVMFMPGVRYEKTYTNMMGYYSLPAVTPPTMYEKIPGNDSAATRSDIFFLPMIHLRIKPTNTFYVHLSYTKTLSRPDFNAIMPNYYINAGWAPYTYAGGNPSLKTELWESFDAQLVFHADKIGLLSLTGFYKKVDDKLWGRNYNRIKGDPIVPPFKNTDVVNITVWENNKYKTYVEGFEIEWQTNFSYLPSVFKYLTFTSNYTYTKSESYIPFSKLMSVVPPGGGRPQSVRFDTVYVFPMANQPRHIINLSLGFNKAGFNAWLSYQYQGLVISQFGATPELNLQKDYFLRWDLQLTQKFKIKGTKGLELIANIANLSNYVDKFHYMDQPNKYTTIDKFGWTVDLGLRLKL